MHRALQVLLVLLAAIILGSSLGVGAVPHPIAAQASQPTAAPTTGFPFPEGRLVTVGVTRDKQLEIFTSNTDGSDKKQLTSAGNSPSSPVWSPNGRYIAFTAATSSVSTTRQALYVMDSDGTNLKLLSNQRSGPFRWSPDGQRIAFISSKGGYNQIFLIEVDGRAERQLTHTTEDVIGPWWAPDGKRILYSRSDGIYLINLDGTNDRRVFGSAASDAIWSPDGTSLLFVPEEEPGEIRPLKLDGEISEAIFEADGAILGMAWSPDGKRVAVVTREGGRPPDGSTSTLYVMTVDNWNAQTLAVDVGVDWASPSWSPDSSFMVYSGEDSNLTSNIYIADVYGTNARIVTNLGSGYFPTWRPGLGVNVPCCLLGGPLPER